MEPTQPITTDAPQPTPKKRITRTAVALILLISPTVLFVLTFLGFALVNLFLGQGIPDQDPALNPNPSSPLIAPIVVSVLNTLFFIGGVISVLTWVPGIVIGIILLATKKPTPPAQS